MRACDASCLPVPFPVCGPVRTCRRCGAISGGRSGSRRRSNRIPPRGGDRHPQRACDRRRAQYRGRDRAGAHGRAAGARPQGPVPLRAGGDGDRVVRPLRHRRHPHPRPGRQPGAHPHRRRAGARCIRDRQLLQRQPQLRRPGHAQTGGSGARAEQFAVRLRRAGRGGSVRDPGPGRLSGAGQGCLLRLQAGRGKRLGRPVRRRHCGLRRRALVGPGRGGAPPGPGDGEHGRRRQRRRCAYRAQPAGPRRPQRACQAGVRTRCAPALPADGGGQRGQRRHPDAEHARAAGADRRRQHRGTRRRPPGPRPGGLRP